MKSSTLPELLPACSEFPEPRKYKRLQGGFLWEWYDHGIYTEEEGQKYYKYGGNYEDFPTNGNFCIDGILMPDRTPSPGMEGQGHLCF